MFTEEFVVAFVRDHPFVQQRLSDQPSGTNRHALAYCLTSDTRFEVIELPQLTFRQGIPLPFQDPKMPSGSTLEVSHRFE